MIRKSLGLLLVVGISVGSIVACGSDDDGPTFKYPSADSFCTAKAAEECKVVGPVCAVTDETCKSRRKSACDGLAAGAGGEGRVYTATKAETCITKTTEVYKDRVIDPVKEKAFVEACEGVFVGSKGESAPCTKLYECKEGLTCDVEKGFCAKKVEKTTADSPCNNPGDICGKGLYCQQRGGAKFCSARNKLGDLCNTKDAPCLEDLRCTTTCVALIPAGGPCDTNDECVTNSCNTDRKCAARIYPSESGTCKDFGGT